MRRHWRYAAGAVYLKYGCGGCHGPVGKGGVPNPNADPDETVPPVMSDPDMADIFIESYILEGIMDIAKLDRKNPRRPSTYRLGKASYPRTRSPTSSRSTT